MDEFIKIAHLTYSYPGLIEATPVISDLSFHINEGEFIVLTGPAGCGKSTLLSLIAGILIPKSGFITINGKEIKACGKSIGYMKQSDNSFVQMNELMNTYGFISFPEPLPPDSSEGMKQRAALIQTLLMESDILLLDEPFSALTPPCRQECLRQIRELIRAENKTAILATAEYSEPTDATDRMILLSDRPKQ